MKTKVWALNYGWPDGEATHIFGSRPAAEAHLHAIVQDQWAEGVMDGEVQPADPQEAVGMYFDYMGGDEWYKIEEHSVFIPLDLPEDEVILSSSELDVTVWALKKADVYAAGEQLGVSPGSVLEYINSARAKLEE